jgi:hypothetical protein
MKGNIKDFLRAERKRFREEVVPRFAKMGVNGSEPLRTQIIPALEAADKAQDGTDIVAMIEALGILKGLEL